MSALLALSAFPVLSAMMMMLARAERSLTESPERVRR